MEVGLEEDGGEEVGLLDDGGSLVDDGGSDEAGVVVAGELVVGEGDAVLPPGPGSKLRLGRKKKGGKMY